MSILTGEKPTAAAESAGSERPDGVGSAWQIVATREVIVKLTDKNFLISTAFTLVLLAGILLLQGVLANRTTTHRVAVTQASEAAVIEAANRSAHAQDGSVTIRAIQVQDRTAGEQALRAQNADALLTKGADGWTVTTRERLDSGLRTAIASAAREASLAQNAAAAGTTVEALNKGSALNATRLDGKDTSDELVLKFIGVIFAMLFYMAALLFGLQIATSVIEEKQSRIVEILTTAIPIRQLLTGKVVGNTVIAFGQMALFVGVGLVGLSFTSYNRLLPSISGAAGWFLVFFLAGFVALACVWAAAGSLATRSEDLQSTTTPLSLLLVVALLVGITLEGTGQVIASYVPIVSAIAMPARLLAGGAAWWEPVIALGLTLAFAAGTILAGARLYRRSLLQTSSRLSLRQAWRARG